MIIHVVSGKGNYISNNHIVATTAAADVEAVETGSCFSMQVEALLTTKESEEFGVIAVLVEKESIQNTILDSGTEKEVRLDKSTNAFRATPTPIA